MTRVLIAAIRPYDLSGDGYRRAARISTIVTVYEKMQARRFPRLAAMSSMSIEDNAVAAIAAKSES